MADCENLKVSDIFAGKVDNGEVSSKQPYVGPKLKGSPKQKDRLARLVDTIANGSAFGRSLMDAAAKNGYTLMFLPQKDTCGFCDAQNKTIALNPRMDDRLLIATLAHEGRHAQQFANGAPSVFGSYALKCEIMLQRALEADAESVSAAVCFEIAKGNQRDRIWQAFAKESPEIARGFLSAANGKDKRVTDKMLCSAFDGWFNDTAMLSDYEDATIRNVMNTAMMKNETAMLSYANVITSKQLVNRFCHNADGKCYWAERPNVLDDPDKLSIEPLTFLTAEKFFSVRQMREKMREDDSYKTLKIRYSFKDVQLFKNPQLTKAENLKKDKPSVSLNVLRYLEKKER